MTLKQRVKNAGLTQNKVAKEIGVHRVQLCKWLNGSVEMPKDKEEKVKRICSEVEAAIKKA